MSDLKDEISAAEFIKERMKQDPKIRRIVSDAHVFDDLKQMAGWRRLYETVKADKAKVMQEVAARLMKGDRPSQEEIEYYRGFYQGAVYVLEHPAQAEANLERAARTAWVLAQSATGTEEDSPDG